MGGRVALHVALAAPERVTRLTLVATTAGIDDDLERARRRAADAELAEAIDSDGLEAFAERWLAQPLFADDPPAAQTLARADIVRNDPAGLAAALRGIGTGAMAPLWDRLGELDDARRRPRRGSATRSSASWRSASSAGLPQAEPAARAGRGPRAAAGRAGRGGRGDQPLTAGRRNTACAFPDRNRSRRSSASPKASRSARQRSGVIIGKFEPNSTLWCARPSSSTSAAG